MNTEPAQESNSLSKVIIFVFVLLVGVVLGLGSAYFLSGQKQTENIQAPPNIQAPTSEDSTPRVDEKKLPISLELLQNPIVYEWRGSVEGKLVSKSDHTFTIEDQKGNKISITNITSTGEIFKTLFYKISDGGTVKISLNDIPLGATLRGDVWIFKGGKNIPIGGSFEVVE